MQFSTGERLKRAAAAPTHPLDFPRARRRGLIQRSVAMAAAATGIAGLITAGVVFGPHVLGGGRGNGPAPVAGPCDPASAPQLTAYLEDDVSDAELRQLTAYMTEREGVASFEYVTKREAYEEFQRINADEPELWANLPVNALPASFRLQLTVDATADAIEVEVSRLAGVDEVHTPRAVRGGAACDAELPLCGPIAASNLETTISRARDGDHVDHVGIHLEITVSSHSPACVPSIYIELDGRPLTLPDERGTRTGGLASAATPRAACVVGDSVAGNLLYGGRHVVGIGTGCDPNLPAPYLTQRSFEYDGDKGALVPSEAPLMFCAHARYLDELQRAPTDEELARLVQLAPAEVRADASLLVASARAHREGDNSVAQTDRVQEAADRFDEYVADEC